MVLADFVAALATRSSGQSYPVFLSLVPIRAVLGIGVLARAVFRSVVHAVHDAHNVVSSQQYFPRPPIGFFSTVSSSDSDFAGKSARETEDSIPGLANDRVTTYKRSEWD